MRSRTLYLLSALVFIFLLDVGSISADKISKNSITIESDKSVYYCEPIYNEKGECLIRATITVNNTAGNTRNLDGLTSFSTNIADTKFKSKDAKQANKVGKHSMDKIQLKSNEAYQVELEFWTKENGKFNFTVSAYQQGNGNLLATTILDPVYNITTNSTSPSWYLVNGTARNGSISSFESATDVYPALSDDNASTNFHTQFGGLIFPSENIAYYSFNEYLPTTILHEYSGDHDGYIVGSVSSVPGSYYAGMNFDGNDFIVVDDTHVPSHFDFVDNFTMCAKIAMNDTTERYIINKQSSGDGFVMRVTGTGQPSCTIDGVTGSRTVTATSGAASAVDNGAFHIICCVYSSPNTILYVDAIQRDIVTTTAGAVSNTEDFYIGSGNLGSTFRFVGNIMELALWDRSFTTTDLLNINGSALFNDFTKAHTIDPFFNRTTSCTTCTYYLTVTSQTDDITSVQVMAYQNMTDVNQTNFLRTNILTGESFININSLISPTYNLPFRLWSIIGDSQSTISELHLLEVGNDTVAPVISNCSLNDTVLTCGETVRGQCTITDDIGVQSANGTVFDTQNITVYPLNRLTGDIWYTDQLLVEIAPIVLNITIDNVTAIDLGGNVVTYDPNLTATYTCLPGCTEDWQENLTIPCELNDSYIKEYYDANACGTFNDTPIDNGTLTACNFCSEAIINVSIGNCSSNGTEEYEYQDTNYFSCCALTGILGDCSILYSPYNETFFQSCIFLTSEFSLDVDSEVFFGFGIEKVTGKIWLNDTNNTYSCISYVKASNNQIVQTNPTYTQRNNAFLLSREVEDREYFQTTQGLANVYWTNDELVIDGRNYVFGVECAGNNQLLVSEKSVIVSYEPINSPTTRFFWAGKNMGGIVLGGIILIVVLFLGGFLIWVLKSGVR